MSSRIGAMWSAGAPSAALAVAVLALGACGSSTKGRSSAPVVGDRRELPPIHVAPVDSGLARPPPAAPAAPPPPAFPRTVTLGEIGEGERIADLAVLAQSERFLLAWVTYFDGGGPAIHGAPRRAGKKAPPPPPPPPHQKQGASVMVRVLDAQGEAIGSPNVISVKADSIGGVSLAAGASAGEAALGWVGKDAGIGQVFVTRLSRAGEKQMQRMITHSKEGCSDVALVRYKDGFVVAYIDSRDGHGGLYAAKIGKDLERVGPERIVAETKGEASDVRMIARGDELVFAWSEARQNPEVYGVFAARLLAADLSLRGDPARIVLGAQQTKGVELAALDDGVALGWVEDSPPAAAAATTSPKTALLIRLDAALRGTAEPIRVDIPAQASSLALDCDRSCRVVVAASAGDELAFYGFFYDGRPSPAARLVSIAGVSTEDTNPALARDRLFFAEDNLHGTGRIRQAKLLWR